MRQGDDLKVVRNESSLCGVDHNQRIQEDERNPKDEEESKQSKNVTRSKNHVSKINPNSRRPLFQLSLP